jgi:hypothetical protein
MKLTRLSKRTKPICQSSQHSKIFIGAYQANQSNKPTTPTNSSKSTKPINPTKQTLSLTRHPKQPREPTINLKSNYLLYSTVNGIPSTAYSFSAGQEIPCYEIQNFINSPSSELILSQYNPVHFFKIILKIILPSTCKFPANILYEFLWQKIS